MNRKTNKKGSKSGNPANSRNQSCASASKSQIPDHYTFTLDSEDNIYDSLSFTEVKNTIDLIALYIDVNQKVIERKKTSRIF